MPVQFKIEKGKTSRIPKGGRFLWSGSTICQILRNEIYIGNTVQKKYEKDFVGGKNHIKPREEWLVTYGHHEPVLYCSHRYSNNMKDCVRRVNAMFAELSKEMVGRYIEKIEAYDEQHMKIRWKND